MKIVIVIVIAVVVAGLKVGEKKNGISISLKYTPL